MRTHPRARTADVPRAPQAAAPVARIAAGSRNPASRHLSDAMWLVVVWRWGWAEPLGAGTRAEQLQPGPRRPPPRSIGRSCDDARTRSGCGLARRSWLGSARADLAGCSICPGLKAGRVWLETERPGVTAQELHHQQVKYGGKKRANSSWGGVVW